MARTDEQLIDFQEEMRQDRMREALDTHRDMLMSEFEDSYSDMDLARLMVANNDADMTWEDWIEIQFEEYCEMRDD